MNKNKIILFSNLKGGTGKTTLCELFATYCVEKEMPVTVMDADPQLSLWKDRRDDLESKPESEIPWKVTPLIVNEEILEVAEKIQTIPGEVLVDCPGSLENQYLQVLFEYADVIVIPFRFDRKNTRETTSFAEIVRKINPKAKLLFVPNLVTVSDDKRQNLISARQSAYESFGKYGFITPRIMERVAVRDTSTLCLNTRQRFEIRFAFEKIVEFIKR